jgi:hypothetical protein
MVVDRLVQNGQYSSANASTLQQLRSASLRL